VNLQDLILSKSPLETGASLVEHLTGIEIGSEYLVTIPVIDSQPEMVVQPDVTPVIEVGGGIEAEIVVTTNVVTVLTVDSPQVEVEVTVCQ
jgi:hypothetical protein